MSEVTVTAATATEQTAAYKHQKELYREVWEEDFFAKYGLIGKDANSVIQLKTDFTKEQGDAMVVTLSLEPSDDGIHADGWVEGNEMDMDFVHDTITLDEYGHAMRTKGKLTEQRFNSGNLRGEMKTALANWWNNKKSTWIFKQLSGTAFYGYPGTASGTPGSLTEVGNAAVANTNVIYGGDASSTATIDETDTLTPDLISIAKLSAKTGYINSSTQIHKVRPTMVNGKPYYIMICHPYALFDLKKTDEWKQAMLEAERRGPENPIFTGATAIFDGVIIYESDKVVTASTWGSGGNVYGAINLLLGAQAGAVAVAQDGPDWVEDQFNYGKKWGVYTGMIMGVKKTQFYINTSASSKTDFGVIAIKTAAKHPNG